MIKVKSYDNVLNFQLESKLNNEEEILLSKFIENFWWIYKTKRDKMKDPPTFYVVLYSIEKLLSEDQINELFKIYTKLCIPFIKTNRDYVSEKDLEHKLFNFLSYTICYEANSMYTNHIEYLK